MTTLLFALLVPNAQAAPRIVNGQVAAPGEFPEVVGVLAGGTCTGSLINRRWVLTAAHCFDSIDIELVPSGNASVTFGNLTLQPDRTVAAERVIIHPEYVSFPNSPSQNGLGSYEDVDGYESITNDLALIRLAEDVEGTVMAINSAPITEEWIGRGVTHIGFGLTESDANDADTKRFAEVPITSFTLEHSLDAPDNNGGVSFFDAQGGRSTCQGDSGGPGVFYQGDGYAQVGITSFGSSDCGAGPSTKMRTDLYVDWIEQTAGITLIKEFIRPATFQCSHQLNPGAVDSIAIGVVPMELQCVVDAGDPQNIDEVTWFWGDGSDPEIRTDLLADHTYDTMGVYNLRACINGDRAGNPFQDCVLRSSHVNVCSEPEASFEATPQEGLRVDLRNNTSLRAHNCVSNAEWKVYSGPSATGEPIRTLSSWQPDIRLDEEGPGTYTIVLSVGGLGGTGAAEATVEVGRGAGGCSSIGGWPVLAPIALLPLFGMRRRR